MTAGDKLHTEAKSRGLPTDCVPDTGTSFKDSGSLSMLDR